MELPFDSPFPGMNPYLEGYLWSDVHGSLASEIKGQLAPRLRPNYTARLTTYVTDDDVPSDEVGIFYPDVEVLRPPGQRRERTAPADTAVLPAISPPTTVIPATVPLRVRLTSVQIRDIGNNELITSIEILSPANKRRTGRERYRQKRADLLRAGVHLVEIDLIRRRGHNWLPGAENLPTAPYVMVVTRAGQPTASVWAVALADRLPTLPIPLRGADRDVPLDLQAAMDVVYEESDYNASIDYDRPPPPPAFDEETLRWIDTRLRAAGLRS